AGKAANGAVDTLHSRLPSGSIIIIMKTNSTERSMLDYTVDQITKSVVQAGNLKVVDRSNETLIDAEQQYQLSGNVSDDSIVSIGHQLGAQYMALCWISGQMSGRRFNIRILNVETAQIAAQNDFEI
ncbi:MAG: penicillin-binding protein activator LpoB, partial [Treponema sp.]|nr:penicillin-binding protein activator LpoB [Treponema sp.]